MGAGQKGARTPIWPGAARGICAKPSRDFEPGLGGGVEWSARMCENSKCLTRRELFSLLFITTFHPKKSIYVSPISESWLRHCLESPSTIITPLYFPSCRTAFKWFILIFEKNNRKMDDKTITQGRWLKPQQTTLYSSFKTIYADWEQPESEISFPICNWRQRVAEAYLKAKR